MKLKNKDSSKTTATLKTSSLSTDRKARMTRDTSRNFSRGKKIAFFILGVLVVVTFLLSLSVNSFALGTTPAVSRYKTYIVGNVYTSGGNYTTASTVDERYAYVTNKNGSASTRYASSSVLGSSEALVTLIPVFSESNLRIEIPIHSYYPYLRINGALEPDGSDPITHVAISTNHNTPVSCDVIVNYYTASPEDGNLAYAIAYGFPHSFTSTETIQRGLAFSFDNLASLIPSDATYIESVVINPHLSDFTGSSVLNNSLEFYSSSYERFSYTAYMLDSYEWINDTETAINSAYSQGYNRGLSESVDAGWFAEGVDSILSIELFEYDTGNVILHFTLGTIFMVTLGALTLIWLLRMFAGG